MSHELFDYQRKALADIRATGQRRVLLVMPTGAGKTRTLQAACEPFVRKQLPVLWVAHRKELLSQAAVPGVTMVTPGAALQYAGDAPRLVVLDEAHHYVSDEWVEVPRRWPDALILGATATPERGDGRGLDPVFDRIVVGPTVGELVKRGRLVPARTFTANFRLKAGQLAMAPWEAYWKYAAGRRTIVFCRDLDHAKETADGFAQAGILAHHVSGDDPLRAEKLEAHKRGEFQVLCNVHLLTEGYDDPAVECVILARRFTTAGAYIQAVGRGRRADGRKVDCVVIDLTGSVHEFGDLEAPREYSLTGRGIKLKADRERFCPLCGMVWSEDWVACGRCNYVQEDNGVETRIVGKDLQPYAAKRKESRKDVVYTIARWIATARDRGYASGWTYIMARKVYGVTPPADVMADAWELSERMQGKKKPEPRVPVMVEAPHERDRDPRSD